MRVAIVSSFVLIISCGLAIVSDTRGGAIGPLVYNDKNDSPFDLTNLGKRFHLEDFSRELEVVEQVSAPDSVTYLGVKFSTPGVMETSGNSLSRTGKFVDGSLGAIGRITDSESHARSIELSFEFDINELGELPQAVGFAITNYRPVTTAFYGGSGDLLATLHSPAIDLLSSADALAINIQSYGQKRFLGAIFTEGISRVTVSAPGSFAFIDDFQYGRLVPEPSSSAIVAIAVIALVGFARGDRRGAGRTP